MTQTGLTVNQGYLCDGVIVDFAIPFTYVNDDEVGVYLRNESVDPPTETLLANPAEYTIDDDQTTVTTGTAYSSDYRIFLRRNTPLTQENDFQDNDGAPSETHELGLDKLTRIVQEIDETLNRSILIPITTDLSGLEYPVPEAYSILRWNSTEDELENLSITATAPVVFTELTGVISMAAATASNSGYLTAADWVTFNSKMTAGSPAVSATELGYLDGATSNIQDQIDAIVSGSGIATIGTSTDNALARWDGVGGTAIQNSGWTLDNSDVMTGVELILSGLTADTVPYANSSKQLTSSAVTPTELGYVSGVTSAIQTQLGNKQGLDATLTALAAYNTNGLLTQTAADTFTGRTITGTANQVVVSNGDGVSGNPTLSTPQNIHSAATPTFAGLTLTAFSGVLSAAAGVVSAGAYTQSNEIVNLGLSLAVGSSALTIAMKDASGSDPSSSSPVRVGFRSATLTTGTYSEVTITGAMSTVISSGSTAGHTSGVAWPLYVYLLNNAGTAELAWSATLYQEGGVISTTAEGGAGAADTYTTVYSTTARTNVAFRLIGKLTSNQATAGTWASVPTVASLAPFDDSALQPFGTKPKKMGCASLTYSGGTPQISSDATTFISSITDTGTGVMTLVLVPGAFQGDVRSNANLGEDGTGIVQVSGVSSSAVRYDIVTTAGAATDRGLYVMIWGSI